MTARTCPIHGEYSATGVCRWCEKPSGADQSTITLPLLCICKTCLRGFEAPIPLTSLECPECRAKRPRKVHPDVPNGSMFCRCGEYAWAPWCPPAEREGVIAGVAHSPEQCFKLDAEPPDEPRTFLDVALSGPKVRAPPVSEPTPWVGGRQVPAEEIASAIRERRFSWPIYRPTAADLPIQPPVVLAYQHAALRWERVVRRWGSKRGPLTWGDLLERLTRPNPLLQDAPWREPTP